MAEAHTPILNGHSRGVPVELVLPRGYWEEGLRHLLRPEVGTETVLHSPLSEASLRDRRQLIAGASPARARQPGEESSLTFAVAASQTDIYGHREQWNQAGQSSSGDILLISGVEERRGWLQAWIRHGDKERQVACIRLPGSGMHRVTMDETPQAAGGNVQNEPSARRWSRTIGALTEKVWRRLTRMRIGLVGCGRLGSLLATGLARTGVSEWVLVDPDLVERHNLGESAVWTKEDLGTSKAESLARHLQRICPWVQAPEAVPHSVAMEPARRALRECDVLLCCADAGSGRLATGILAALYHRPLIDVGTGVFASGDGQEIGAEVRLALPGDGCLQCTGGTARPEEAQAALQSADAERAITNGRSWNDERAGSLRSWNTVTAGVAQRALESLVAEDIGQSGWWRLRWSENALQHQRQEHSSTGEDCLCSLAGRGDEGISEVQARMREHG